MSKIVIVVETGSDISEELKKQYGIYTVPMHVTFGNEEREDGTFPPEEVCEYYRKTGNLPKTSSSTPYDYKRVFDEIRSKDPSADILHLGYSAVTTGSFENALRAKGDDSHICCVDTKNVSFGQTAVAVKVAELVRSHPDWTLKQAAEAAKCVREQTKMIFVPDELEYLKAGGRVSTPKAFLGSLLGIHPVIELKDGYLVAADKIRGYIKRTLAKIFSFFVTKYAPEKDEIWLGATTGFSEELMEAAQSIAEELGFRNIRWIKAGGVITTHGGPGAFGIAAYCKSV